tara:strand:+ start:293 stop:712 length:420 start_codon:yes stop_codon:yes gene_type:complete
MTRKTTQLLFEVNKSIGRIGIEATIKHLRKTDKATSNNIIDFVIEKVCEELGATRDILYEIEKTAIRKQTHQLTFYLLYKFAALSQGEIATIFGLSKAPINRRIKEVERYNANLKHEKKMIGVLSELEKEINAFIDKNI